MSHFTVLVVGKDVEKALAPYHEFECTGEDDEFVVSENGRRDMKFEYELEREREDHERFQRTGIESYEQKVDRWREDWRRELDEDLENGR